MQHFLHLKTFVVYIVEQYTEFDLIMHVIQLLDLLIFVHIVDAWLRAQAITLWGFLQLIIA